MKLSMIVAGGALALVVSAASPAAAAKPYKNLKVLKDNGKQLKKGMKGFTKGLGVKCKTCHVKGKWSSDDVEVKDKTRAFFRDAVGQKNAAKKQAALADLLKILKLDAAKDPAKLWAGVALLEKE